MATRFLKVSSNGNKILKSRLMAAPSNMIFFISIFYSDMEDDDDEYKIEIYQFIMQNHDCIDRKVWISSLKQFEVDSIEDEEILEHCEELAREDYKLIPSLIGLKWGQLRCGLWLILLKEYLASFLAPPADDLDDWECEERYQGNFVFVCN